MRPTLRLAGALGLGAVLYVYGATSEVAWLFLLGVLVWALVPAAFAYAVWNRRGLVGAIHPAAVRAAATSPLDLVPDALLRDAPLPAPVFEGDELELSFALQSRRGERGPALLTAEVGGERLEAGAGRVGKRGWQLRRRLPDVRRGVVAAEDVRLVTGDPAGLFRRAQALPDGEVAVVFPLFSSLAESVRVREVESVLTAPRAGQGNEIFGVREYRPGDPLRRIHWRSSARRGELVVREMEPPGLRVVGLLLDERPPSREAADQLARLAASEAWDCLRAGGRALLWTPGREPSPACGNRGFWSLLDWLARYPDDLPVAEGLPPPFSEAIGFLAGGDEVAALLHDLRLRGGDVRAWLLGDGDEPEYPTRRAGLEWPLAS